MLKYEEVYGHEYRDLVEARASIEHFLEKSYNEKRLPSALGYHLKPRRLCAGEFRPCTGGPAAEASAG